MSIEKKCIECSVIVVDEWFFGCNGFMCSKVISYSCAASQAKKLLTKYPNDVKKGMKIIMDCVPGLLWFCPECLVRIHDNHNKIDNSLKRIAEMEETLKNSILAIKTPMVTENRRVTRAQTKASTFIEDANLLQTVTIQSAPSTSTTTKKQTASISSTITPTITPSETPPALLLTDTNGYTTTATTSTTGLKATTSSSLSVSKKGNSTKQVVHTPAVPVFSTESCAVKGTYEPEMESAVSRPAETMVVDAAIDSVTDTNDYNIRVTQPRRWLFISRIHSSVPDAEFQKLLAKILCIDTAFAQRITPKSANGINFDYISYKINIPGESFNAAINSKLWPAGLLVKEFEWGQKRSFFHKLRSNHQIR